MSILQDAVVSIYRLTKDADNADKEQYQANAALASVKCQIQPATASETAIAEGVFGKTYTMFTTESGIKEGDKVVLADTGEIFRVKGIMNWADIDLIPHYEMTLVEFEEEKV